jgi:Major Facilitator Superfamily
MAGPAVSGLAGDLHGASSLDPDRGQDPAVNGSVVAVALPAIQADLNTSVAGAQWVVNAYALMLGALILAGGSAGDRFGRRRVFALGSLRGLRIGAEHRNSDRRSGGAGRRWRAYRPPGSLAIISAAFPADKRGEAIGHLGRLFGPHHGCRTGPRGLAGGRPVLARDFLHQCADCLAHARLGILARS